MSSAHQYCPASELSRSAISSGEELVDNGVDLALGFFDLGRQAAHPCAFLAQIAFPLVALF
jgi:hypothetical protein